MTFIHGYLLGGLVLVGLPVLIHLIMRQRPRPLSFPAFRFLRQQHRSVLKTRHWQSCLDNGHNVVMCGRLFGSPHDINLNA